MTYEYDGMRKIPWEAVLEMFDGENLTGCYYLYPDGTEAQIDKGYTWQDILKHHENGGEFGLEKKKTVDFESGKKAVCDYCQEVNGTNYYHCENCIVQNLWYRKIDEQE